MQRRLLFLTAIDLTSSLVAHRYRARVTYDGTDFLGFQRQGGDSKKAGIQRTVQQVLETVFSQRFHQPIRVVAASRTDAGVHARGQAIHFDVREPHGNFNSEALHQIEYAFNRMLPSDVRVFHVQNVPPPVYKTRNNETQLYRWNAMMDCTGKLYSYRLSLSHGTNHPIDRYVRWHPDKCHEIDLEVLARMIKHYEGTQNFRAFAGNVEQLEKRALGGDKLNTVRTVYSVKLVEEQAPGHVRIDFHIKGALYKQIRNMVGTALDVARGRVSEEHFLWLLRSGEATRKDNLSKPGPAQGLTLEQVYYDDEAGSSF